LCSSQYGVDRDMDQCGSRAGKRQDAGKHGFPHPTCNPITGFESQTPQLQSCSPYLAIKFGVCQGLLPYSKSGRIGATTFQVTGMTCGHCQRAVTEEISGIPGIQGVTVDLATGSVTVTATQPVDRTDVAHAVGEAGYTLIP